MKEKSTHHRDAIDKVAEAVDNALVGTVHTMDAEDGVNLDHILMSLAEARAYIVQAKLAAHVRDAIESITPPDDLYRGQVVDVTKEYVDNANRGEWVASVEAAKKGLPKLKPQGHAKVKYRPGIQKLLKGAIAYECPTCRAEAHTNCFKYEGPGKHPKRTDIRNDGSFFHTKRVALAKAANDRVRKQNILP